MNRHKYLASSVSLFCLLALNVGIYGQGPWQKKPYQEWSESETSKLLYESPWAQSKSDRYSSYFVNIRLHSALPIRQALVRTRQIRINYKRLTDADKARFDSEVSDFVQCLDCAKYYAVTITIWPQDPKVLREIQALSFGELKLHVFLTNEKGERRDLVNFVPPTRQTAKALFSQNAIFYFDRVDQQGKPLLTIDNQKFHLHVEDKILRSRLVPKGKVTFDVSKLVHNGEVIF